MVRFHTSLTATRDGRFVADRTVNARLPDPLLADQEEKPHGEVALFAWPAWFERECVRVDGDGVLILRPDGSPWRMIGWATGLLR